MVFPKNTKKISYRWFVGGFVGVLVSLAVVGSGVGFGGVKGQRRGKEGFSEPKMVF